MAKIKKSELKNHLLKGVQILKTKLNYAEYCYFILAVLFFYHSGSVDIVSARTMTNYQVPRIVTANQGTTRVTFQRKKRDSEDELSEAFSEYEGLNPQLKNVLLSSIPTPKITSPILNGYLDQVEQLQNETSIFSNTESFSLAYDYWISQLAKLTVKQGSSFYTPRSVIRLMVGITKPREGMTIYDPTVGTGGMFTESARYIKEHGGDINLVAFYGCETAPDIWAICKMNLLAHRLENITIEQQDALLASHELFGKFDLILQNIPLPDESNSRRQIYQLNEAFLKHAISGMAEDGRGALLMPVTVLQEDHDDFWRQIINHDWLEAVIGLPAKLLHGTNASAYIIVINKQKVDAHAGKVLFVRAVDTPLPYTRHNELEDKDIDAVIHAYESWERVPDYANVVSNSTIGEHGYKLSVDKYLSVDDESAHIDITAALKRYHSAVQEREAAVARLMKSLEAHYGSVEPD